MRQMTTNFVVPAQHETLMFRVTGPVRQIDIKERRRKRVSALSKVVNELHKETLARLAK